MQEALQARLVPSSTVPDLRFGKVIMIIISKRETNRFHGIAISVIAIRREAQLEWVGRSVEFGMSVGYQCR